MPFFELKIRPFFLFSFSVFVFFQKSSSFCRENEIFQKNKRKIRKTQFFALKIRPIMLRNLLGRIFNATLDGFSTQQFCYFWAFFSFLKKCRNHYFFKLCFQPNNELFKPTPKNLRTLFFVNTTALTDFLFVRFFCIFAFLGFCCVRFFGGSVFERNEKTKKDKIQNKTTKKQKRKKDHKMQIRRPLSLVTKNLSCFCFVSCFAFTDYEKHNFPLQF